MIALLLRSLRLKELTPKRIVTELDKYIIGQHDAKKCVAIAIRNRWRRQQLSPAMRNEVAPKNIIMIGPTGVGKTEIARRLARLVNAPFLKVEASKYTEVGYHGRDVESMVRELAELSTKMVREQHTKAVSAKVDKIVEEKLLDLLLPSPIISPADEDSEQTVLGEDENFQPISQEISERRKRSRGKMRKKLAAGQLEKRMVDIMIEERNTPMVEIFSNAGGGEQMGAEIQNMFEKIIPGRQRTKKTTVAEAREILLQQESENLIDREKVTQEALKQTENMGIIFIDEIDKVVGSDHKHGPDISREGVQRDLLPIIEGSSIITRYGIVHTDHILFIAAGAFSKAKPADLIPELQGRFPIRVELGHLNKQDFVRILQEPENALIKQYKALLATEKLHLQFTEEAIDEIAAICTTVNQRTQNIGARRLHTIMEKLLEGISFAAPEMEDQDVVIDRNMVKQRLTDIMEDEDLSRYIL